MFGLKKTYSVYKNLNGTALMQYNLINEYFNNSLGRQAELPDGFENGRRNEISLSSKSGIYSRLLFNKGFEYPH
jgi:hypothetical protein